jgi:hypothetical protein
LLVEDELARRADRLFARRLKQAGIAVVNLPCLRAKHQNPLKNENVSNMDTLVCDGLSHMRILKSAPNGVPREPPEASRPLPVAIE